MENCAHHPVEKSMAPIVYTSSIMPSNSTSSPEPFELAMESALEESQSGANILYRSPPSQLVKTDMPMTAAQKMEANELKYFMI